MRKGLLALILAVFALAGCGSSSSSTTTTTVTVAASTSSPTTISSSSTTATPTSNTSTTTSTSSSASPVYFEGVVSPGRQRPRTLELTGDGTLFVNNVQWTSWGGTEAIGSGSAEWHGCNPNCASAPQHTALVSIRLSNVRACKGRQYYAALTLTLNSGKLLLNQYVQRSWSPC